MSHLIKNAILLLFLVVATAAMFPEESEKQESVQVIKIVDPVTR